jgi:hypothetical protein
MKNSATYWVTKIKQLHTSLKTSTNNEKNDYKNAIRYAEKKLRIIRQRCGVHV